MSDSILFIDQFGEIAGGQVMLQALIKAAKEDGRRVAILAPMGGALESALRKDWNDSVDLRTLKPLDLQHGKKGFGDIARLLAYCLYVPRFRRFVNQFDIVYINGARLALPFGLLSLFCRKPGWWYHLHLCHSGIEKRIFSLIASLPGTRSLIMSARFIYDDFVKGTHRTREDRMCILENCLGAPFSGLPFSDRFSKRQAPLTVALIGRVAHYKGHDVLPTLARRFPDIRFVFIGARAVESGDLLERLLSEGLPNLLYLGETRDLPEVIERYQVHISIVPSRWEEAFGLVSIESMAASCVTLVSNRGMLPQIAAATGAWCFETDDELASMIEELQSMPAQQLVVLAKLQYDKTQSRFGFAAFKASFLAMLGGQRCHPEDDAEKVSGRRARIP